MVSTYYIDLEQALKIVEENINITENDAANTDEYNEVNFPAILLRLTAMKQKIIRMLNIHKYLKVSREGFLNNIQNRLDKVEITHKVTGYDTAHSIAAKYNVTIQELLQTNNIKITEIIPGMTLKIEQLNPVSAKNAYIDIPTYGSQQGDLVLGRDLSNLLTTSGDDLKVLDPGETIVQGIINILTSKKGSYPGEDFGIDGLTGTELPQELRHNLTLTKVLNQLSQDKRIEDAQLSVVFEENKMLIKGSITAINNLQINL